MSHDAAAEAAERKRVMEAVAKVLDAAYDAFANCRIQDVDLAEIAQEAAKSLRTPVGRGRTE